MGSNPTLSAINIRPRLSGPFLLVERVGFEVSRAIYKAERIKKPTQCRIFVKQRQGAASGRPVENAASSGHERKAPLSHPLRVIFRSELKLNRASKHSHFMSQKGFEVSDDKISQLSFYLS